MSPFNSLKKAISLSDGRDKASSSSVNVRIFIYANSGPVIPYCRAGTPGCAWPFTNMRTKGRSTPNPTDSSHASHSASSRGASIAKSLPPA